MRRVPKWAWAVGAAAGVGFHASAKAAGVWVTLAAGLPGVSTPSSEADLWFDSPHAPPYVAVTSAPGTVVAGTDGGTTTFGGLATPVLLNLGNGSAYLAGGGPPDAAKGIGPKGGSAGGRSSAAPVTNATIPDGAALLGLTMADPSAKGTRDLTATLTDASGKSLGNAPGTVTVPDGGWWVVGLGPDSTPQTPPVIDPPVTNPPPVTDPGPTGPPVTNPPPPVPPTDPGPVDNPGPVATPEPSTLALVAVGGVAAGAGRRLRGRKSA
jgi:hypothetical protein